MMKMAKFDPNLSLSDQIRVVENAIVVPWGRGKHVGMARPAGVFTADGTFCADAMTYRSGTRPTTVEPEFPAADEIKEEIKGTVLYGGIAYGHFGHALCESTARLWAVDAFEGQIDRVLFLPKRKVTWPMRSLPVVNALMRSLGELPPAIAIGAPTRVERLVIAPQGFGVNDLVSGSPEFRAFTHERLRETIEGEGPKKIYISRSEVFRKRGRLLLEERIEAYLEAEGYTIFHPQQHDLQAQLAQYKAADVIVSTDNSALHLAAFVARPTCKVAIILRRPGGIYRDFRDQLSHFAKIDPVIGDGCERYWFREGEKVQFNEIISLINFEMIGQVLAEGGFIASANWSNPTDMEIDAALEEFEEKGDMMLTEVSA